MVELSLQNTKVEEPSSGVVTDENEAAQKENRKAKIALIRAQIEKEREGEPFCSEDLSQIFPRLYMGNY